MIRTFIVIIFTWLFLCCENIVIRLSWKIHSLYFCLVKRVVNLSYNVSKMLFYRLIISVISFFGPRLSSVYWSHSLGLYCFWIGLELLSITKLSPWFNWTLFERRGEGILVRIESVIKRRLYVHYHFLKINIVQKWEKHQTKFLLL